MHTILNKNTYKTSYNRKLLNIVVGLMGLLMCMFISKLRGCTKTKKKTLTK